MQLTLQIKERIEQSRTVGFAGPFCAALCLLSEKSISSSPAGFYSMFLKNPLLYLPHVFVALLRLMPVYFASPQVSSWA